MGDPSDWDLIRSEFPDYQVVAPLIKPADHWQAGIEQLTAELPAQSVFVGYSMGARLALACALAKPETCQGLVFVSGNPGLEDEVARQNRQRADDQIADQIDTQPRKDFLIRWYTQSTVFKSLTEKARNDEIDRKAARPGDNWSDILRTFSVANQPNFWPRLCELDIPILAIAGAQDTKYANIITRMGQEANIETRIVATSGHIVHREQPQVFLCALNKYLTKYATAN